MATFQTSPRQRFEFRVWSLTIMYRSTLRWRDLISYTVAICLPCGAPRHFFLPRITITQRRLQESLHATTHMMSWRQFIVASEVLLWWFRWSGCKTTIWMWWLCSPKGREYACDDPYGIEIGRPLELRESWPRGSGNELKICSHKSWSCHYFGGL